MFKTCVNCGRLYDVIPSRADKTKTCSRLCQNEYFRSGVFKGSNNPMFGRKQPHLSKLNKTKNHIETVAEFHRGRKRTEATRKLIGIKSRASRLAQGWWQNEDNPTKLPNWNNKRDYKYTISKELREQVLERDNNKCQACRKEGLEVHHIQPKRLGGKDELKNLLTVCHLCHVRLDYLIIKAEKMYAKRD